jgi:hypothetical protein
LNLSLKTIGRRTEVGYAVRGIPFVVDVVLALYDEWRLPWRSGYFLVSDEIVQLNRGVHQFVIQAEDAFPVAWELDSNVVRNHQSVAKEGLPEFRRLGAEGHA